VKAADEKVALDRFNRSYEYDGLGDAYARFIPNEIWLAAEAKTTGEGRTIKLTKSGSDRAIGESGSGAIAAIAAGWKSPDAFTRVCSVVGT
jgi:hypothetical protein